MDSLYAPYGSAELASPRDVPREFNKFAGFHNGETLLVCGCGSSLNQIVAPERFVSIGVNDVGRLFTPDYLVVVNPRAQFAGDRFHYVENSRARAIFTQLNLGIAHPNIVRFRLGRRGGTDVSAVDSLPYTRNSPYVAASLAMFLGAKRIGVIGVDLTDHHFFRPTGRHSLSGELAQIDSEYAALLKACQSKGIELYNLSAQSRLTSLPKMTPEEFARTSPIPAKAASALAGAKVFFVNYRFITCGDVFSDGLKTAAADLGLESAAAHCDAPDLAQRVEQFRPDLLLVVHGRRFSRRFLNRLPNVRSAVWLLDEPYEVDDTSKFSTLFDLAFLNDPATLPRHKNSHFLPNCYDPAVYFYRPGARKYRVGFIGATNPAREALLDELAGNNLLSYVVGGPWRNPNLRKLCLSGSIPARETADLYRQTEVVINVFRRAGHPQRGPEAAHYYNKQLTQGVAMTPRIYEALACGALVVSERRPEIERLCPEMPVFDGPEELRAKIAGLLSNPAALDMVRTTCIRRLAGHTYAHRLYTVLATALGKHAETPWIAAARVTTPIPPGPALALSPSKVATVPVVPPNTSAPLFDDWLADAQCVQRDAFGVVTLRNNAPQRDGGEVGLVSKNSLDNASLSFEVWIEPGTCFVAKIHLVKPDDQRSNSYHMSLNGSQSYLARHDRVFQNLKVRHRSWEKLHMTAHDGKLRVEINGQEAIQVEDDALESGHCFVGVKTGTARVRNLTVSGSLSDASAVAAAVPNPRLVGAPRPAVRTPIEIHRAGHFVLHDHADGSPVVSIVTAVYDRVDCLERCIRSVQALSFERYEHVIVADSPEPQTVELITALVARYNGGKKRLRLASLKSRANDRGISPAAAGVALARGPYVCFLLDDHGYTPDHFDELVPALDDESSLGFVYSSCRYAGRTVLAHAPPAFGRVDLGQPLFRRELFAKHLKGDLPFRPQAWDWQLIQYFIRAGVRWRHIDRPTFIYQLQKYPGLIV